MGKPVTFIVLFAYFFFFLLVICLISQKTESLLPSLGAESQYIQFSLLAALLLVHFSPVGHFFSGTARSCTHRINTCHYMLHAAAALGTATRTPVSMHFGSCLVHTRMHTYTRSVPSVHLSVPVQEVVCDSNEVDTVDVGTWRRFPRHTAPISRHTLTLWLTESNYRC